MSFPAVIINFYQLSHEAQNWARYRCLCVSLYCADLNQILYESFQVQGNENLMTRCWLHDKMATMPIYGKKPFKNLLFRNQQADFHEERESASSHQNILNSSQVIKQDVHGGLFLRCSRAANSVVVGSIWPKFERIHHSVHVLVTFRFERDQIKSNKIMS